MVGGMSAARRGREAVHRSGRCGRVVGIVGDSDGADSGAGPVASAHGAAVPARRVHAPLHQGGPGRASGSGAHGRSARNRVQYRVIRQICLLISGYA